MHVTVIYILLFMCQPNYALLYEPLFGSCRELDGPRLNDTRDRASSTLFGLVLSAQVELLTQHSPRHPRLYHYLSFWILSSVYTRTIKGISDIAWDSVADVVTLSLERVANVVAPQSVCLSSVSRCRS